MKSNFDFLNRYWPALAQIGATAETYVYSDSNACIYKLGMFAERLVQEILVFEHIAEPAVDNTHANRIRILKRAGLLPHEIDNTLSKPTQSVLMMTARQYLFWRHFSVRMEESTLLLPQMISGPITITLLSLFPILTFLGGPSRLSMSK